MTKTISGLRVLIVSNMYPSEQKKYSGIFVRNQFEELQRLKKEDESIEIFFMRRTFTSTFGSIWKYLLAFLRFIPKLFRKYDVVHLHYFFPLILAVWTYKLFHPKTRLLVTFHGGDINLQVNSRNQRVLRYFAKKVDFTIPVGVAVAEAVQQKLNLSIGKILPVGIDQRTFYHIEDSTKDFDLIYVGSFFPVKGIDILYRTIKQLPGTTRICIVGKGDEYEEKFNSLAEEEFNIHLMIDRSQNELRELYNRSRFLLLPSRSEGFPTVTVEAMYCGTPVITSDIPPFREQVREGENGFMFPLNEPETLPELIRTSLAISDSDYIQMSQGALNSFRELSLNTVCNELLTIYRS